MNSAMAASCRIPHHRREFPAADGACHRSPGVHVRSNGWNPQKKSRPVIFRNFVTRLWPCTRAASAPSTMPSIRKCQFFHPALDRAGALVWRLFWRPGFGQRLWPDHRPGRRNHRVCRLCRVRQRVGHRRHDFPVSRGTSAPYTTRAVSAKGLPDGVVLVEEPGRKPECGSSGPVSTRAADPEPCKRLHF